VRDIRQCSHFSCSFSKKYFTRILKSTFQNLQLRIERDSIIIIIEQFKENSEKLNFTTFILCELTVFVVLVGTKVTVKLFGALAATSIRICDGWHYNKFINPFFFGTFSNPFLSSGYARSIGTLKGGGE
jgi:hypothetical protein